MWETKQRKLFNRIIKISEAILKSNLENFFLVHVQAALGIPQLGANVSNFLRFKKYDAEFICSAPVVLWVEKYSDTLNRLDLAHTCA